MKANPTAPVRSLVREPASPPRRAGARLPRTRRPAISRPAIPVAATAASRVTWRHGLLCTPAPAITCPGRCWPPAAPDCTRARTSCAPPLGPSLQDQHQDRAGPRVIRLREGNAFCRARGPGHHSHLDEVLLPYEPEVEIGSTLPGRTLDSSAQPRSPTSSIRTSASSRSVVRCRCWASAAVAPSASRPVASSMISRCSPRMSRPASLPRGPDSCR